jgi:hypothetical protein
MRFALITLVTVAAVPIAGAPIASSQTGRGQESFFNDQFCMRGGRDNIPDCGYNTWQQCVATARGLGRYCIKNPFWSGPPEQPATQGRSRQRHR